ncbi:uncharacterized protein BX663DRAFT_507623 [Cokeromyces recurvatus]|uniref:uncharacterized protein n=1 Tax=Cokeromyces recurvatus TaxID=90255 RepID=UPI00222024C4|nr:uncharacterized protein BX663DRAFT_507623 [Cokeromyces recurvatus]KAI7903148.1 hypothetical protein BX663DRAFT_507623 [Cokeromyces recurvatus]
MKENDDISKILEQLESSSTSSIQNKLTKNKSKEEKIAKRKQILEKNRIAGTYLYTLTWIAQQKMIDKEKMLSLENKTLTEIVTSLKTEFFALRELLLAHDICECQNIQTFFHNSCSNI